MLVEIKAKFSCDDCGTEFLVGIEPSYDPPQGWSIFCVAEDAIRGGLDYEDGHEDGEPGGMGSVEGERHLCSQCTYKRIQRRTINPNSQFFNE